MSEEIIESEIEKSQPPPYIERTSTTGVDYRMKPIGMKIEALILERLKTEEEFLVPPKPGYEIQIGLNGEDGVEFEEFKVRPEVEKGFTEEHVAAWDAWEEKRNAFDLEHQRRCERARMFRGIEFEYPSDEQIAIDAELGMVPPESKVDRHIYFIESYLFGTNAEWVASSEIIRMLSLGITPQLMEVSDAVDAVFRSKGQGIRNILKRVLLEDTSKGQAGEVGVHDSGRANAVQQHESAEELAGTAAQQDGAM